MIAFGGTRWWSQPLSCILGHLDTWATGFSWSCWGWQCLDYHYCQSSCGWCESRLKWPSASRAFCRLKYLQGKLNKTSFQRHKRPQTKMYTISDTIFGHSCFSWSSIWCGLFCSKCCPCIWYLCLWKDERSIQPLELTKYLFTTMSQGEYRLSCGLFLEVSTNCQGRVISWTMLVEHYST